MPNAHGQNVIRNLGEHPIDCYNGEQHFTIGPFDRLVLPDIGDTNVFKSLMSTACSGSTTGGNLAVEHESDVFGDKEISFTSGTVVFSNQDASQRRF